MIRPAFKYAQSTRITWNNRTVHASPGVSCCWWFEVGRGGAGWGWRLSGYCNGLPTSPRSGLVQEGGMGCNLTDLAGWLRWEGGQWRSVLIGRVGLQEMKRSHFVRPGQSIIIRLSPIMNAPPENTSAPPPSSLPRRPRPIHKLHVPNSSKTAKRGAKVPRKVGFAGAAGTAVAGVPGAQGGGARGRGEWAVRVGEWLQFQPEVLRSWAGLKLVSLPLLSSIDQLFALSSPPQLDPHPDLAHLARYSCIAALSDEQPSVLLGSRRADALLTLPRGRAGSGLPLQAVLLSGPEREAVAKRAVFMEKLKESESKYDSALGRMSQVSKELAFAYRAYLEHRAPLVQTLLSLSPHPQPHCPLEEYARALVGKNLRHALSEQQLDLLNYFRFKEHCEAVRSHPYLPLRSQQELAAFLEKRRPKRGRRLFLATACSVCLSDYCEAANPFECCAVCGIRAHQICLPLARRRCGYCAYQKVERQLKQSVSWCFICHQPGLMVVKFAANDYAHCFCLLVHGYGRVVPQAGGGCAAGRGQKGDLQPVSASLLENSYRSNFYQIEFTSPLQLPTAASLPVPKEQLPTPHSEEDDSDSLYGVGVGQESDCMWQQSQNLGKGGCAGCHQPFFKDCFLSCQRCSREFHSLCAFLSGFQLRINEAGWPNPGSKLQLNCCVPNAGQIGWNRKYKLNYNKIALSSPAFWPQQEHPIIDEPSSPLPPLLPH